MLQRFIEQTYHPEMRNQAVESLSLALPDVRFGCRRIQGVLIGRQRENDRIARLPKGRLRDPF